MSAVKDYAVRQVSVDSLCDVTYPSFCHRSSSSYT